jgi:hypothetical protein
MYEFLTPTGALSMLWVVQGIKTEREEKQN